MNENKIDKDLFCLNYELIALSDVLIRKKAERWVHGFIDNITENEHLDRYEFLLDKVEGKEILDIACGSGYGTFLLSEKGKAKRVIGVDLDENAIKYGDYKYPSENINRIIADATEFNYSIKFDVVVSFETIEHIPDFRKLINNLYDNLKEGGLLYISTPITLKTNRTPNNPYHVIEWSFTDFQNLFADLFEIKEIYIQNVFIKLKEWKVPSLFQKIKNRIVTDSSVYHIEGKKFEIFTGQYDMNYCSHGYQMLVLEKK